LLWETIGHYAILELGVQEFQNFWSSVEVWLHHVGTTVHEENTVSVSVEGRRSRASWRNSLQ
jgi:hypothetical protein